jgi:hypothetical protein
MRPTPLQDDRIHCRGVTIREQIRSLRERLYPCADHFLAWRGSVARLKAADRKSASRNVAQRLPGRIEISHLDAFGGLGRPGICLLQAQKSFWTNRH